MHIFVNSFHSPNLKIFIEEVNTSKLSYNACLEDINLSLAILLTVLGMKNSSLSQDQ